MKTLDRSLVVLSILCSFSLVQGQTRQQIINLSLLQSPSKKETLQKAQLKNLLSKVGVSVVESSSATNNQLQTYREAKIRWTNTTNVLSDSETKSSIGGEKQELVPRISVVEYKKRLGTLPRHRSLELSPTHILIAAVDENTQLRWWSIVPDPRIVRAEFQTSTGDLRSENYYLSNITLGVMFPDDPKIVNLRFYHPLWTGTEFDLKLLAIAPIQ